MICALPAVRPVMEAPTFVGVVVLLLGGLALFLLLAALVGEIASSLLEEIHDQ